LHLSFGTATADGGSTLHDAILEADRRLRLKKSMARGMPANQAENQE
jgi:hypothetical protein